MSHSPNTTTQWIAIVAAAPDGVIGRDGDMPWQLSSDLRRFKRLTMGCPIVMGRKTYESIGRPLPGRRNIVLTRGESIFEGVDTVASIDALLSMTSNEPKCFVVGGATIYDALLPYCSTIYLTQVWTQCHGDTHLRFDVSQFSCVQSSRLPQTSRDSVPTDFQVLQRTRSASP